DPALTLEVIKELGVTPEASVLVGDSGMDMAAAVNAKTVGIGVTWGFRTETELRQNGADYIADTPAQILEIIKEL
ncbi:MAG: HAD family hydrolase, partial [Acutalibacteraceae bacterium]